MFRPATFLLVGFALNSIIDHSIVTGGDNEQNIVDRATVESAISSNTAARRAVKNASSRAKVFVNKWKNRGRHENWFVGVVGMRVGNAIEPKGILVDNMSDECISGKLLDNSLKESDATIDITVSLDKLIDWYYLDAFEFCGGELYWALLSSQSKKFKRSLIEKAPFFLRRKDTMSLKVRQTFSMVANHKGELTEVELTQCLDCGASEHEMAVYRDESIHIMKSNIVEYACVFGSFHTIAAFHDAGLFLGRFDDSTPLAFSSESGNCESTLALIELGFKVNSVDSETGYAPIFLASKRGHVEIVKALLANGADVNIRDYGEETPLHVASNAQIASVLISGGADPNAMDVNGRTPLDIHLQAKHGDVVKMLVASGAIMSDVEDVEDEAMSNSDIAKVLNQHAKSQDGTTSASDLFTAKGIDCGQVLPVKSLGVIKKVSDR
ncbi:MAG: ankyrin repeat domain-containing protein [Rubripirellula sp.]